MSDFTAADKAFREWWVVRNKGIDGHDRYVAHKAWQACESQMAEQTDQLAKSWRDLAGGPKDWETPGEPVDTAIRTSGRATMIQCAVELERLFIHD